MDSTAQRQGAALADCVVPLDEEDRRAVRRYWEQVIQEEWAPSAQPAPRAVPLPEDGRRERREARRSVARIAAAGRRRSGRSPGRSCSGPQSVRLCPT